MNVTGRDLILIHPANDAKLELLGCIAPVTVLTGIGKGSASRKAMTELRKIIFPLLKKNEQVVLVIKSKK